MTTKKFSAIKLPCPTYSLEFGSYDQGFPSWVSRYNDTVHLIEVKKTGYLSKSKDDMSDKLIGSFLMLEDVRPELFLRRDFLQKFVHTGGTIHLTQSGKDSGGSYQMHTVNNVLIMTMSEKQYRRFGLIAKRLELNRATGKKRYRIEVDLKDAKIMSSNKKQDKLVTILRRLDPIKNVYFRFAPANANTVKSTRKKDPNDECLNFFQSVIEEYALDGFQPVPLTGCFKRGQTVQKRWLNCSQLHPPLNILAQTTTTGEPLTKVYQNNELLMGLLDIVDWLGYQLLSLDCDRDEISCTYPDNTERLDVTCRAITGVVDHQHIESKLKRFFGRNRMDEATVFRAVILYNCQDDHSNIVLLQDCSNNCAGQITLLGMSNKGAAFL